MNWFSILRSDSFPFDSSKKRGLRSTTTRVLGSFLISISACSVLAQDANSSKGEDVIVSPGAMEIHKRGYVFDGHNDLPWEMRKAAKRFDEWDIRQHQKHMHTDIDRLRQGNVGAQFWSVYVPAEMGPAGTAYRTTVEQIELVHEMIKRYPDTFQLALNASDIEKARKGGKIASLIGMEGGHSIEDSLANLRRLFEMGARYMTLTHSDTLSWADSATDVSNHGGLSPFGEEVVREMNKLGMLVDLSHVSPETMHDALDISTAPIIFSHSSARAIADHPRNVPDDVLRRLPQNGGVVMINFFSGFVVPESAQIMKEMFQVRRDLSAQYPNDKEAMEKAYKAWQLKHPFPEGHASIIVDHIDHVRKVAGIDHVGLGSDYDGISKIPHGMEDVSKYPVLTEIMLRRGYSEEDIHKVLYANAVRVLREAQAVAEAQPRFEDGQAQIVEAFKSDWIQHDLFVETEFDSDNDGKLDRVHVSVTRPKQTDSAKLKVPVIYQSSPYYSGIGSNDKKYMWNPHQQLGTQPKEHDKAPEIAQQSKRPVISNEHTSEWVPRGFAVVHSCSPGTGLSQGCVTVGGENESLAPKAVIDWLCGRAKGFTEVDSDEEVTAYWSTGKVGMTGTSYNGTLCLAAATTGVQGLEAIIPVAPNTSYYHYYRSHGLIRHPGGYMGEDIDVLYDFVNSGNPDKREYCDCTFRDKEMKGGFDRIDGDYNEFWRKRDYLNQLGKMKAPLLMAHGFNDWNVMPEHSIRIYEAVKAMGIPTQLYVHQAGHGGPPPIKQMNRWFSRYLYGIKNDVEMDKPVWIVREGDARNKPTPYERYPHPDMKFVEFALAPGGIEMGGLVPKTENLGKTKTVETLVDNYSFSGGALAKAEWSNHRLLFATPELQSPIHLSGTTKVKLKIAANKPAVNLSVWMVSLPWTDSRSITDDVITRGWMDPQNYRSLTESEPLVPGEYREVEFELQPDDQIIAKGERIGIMIFSSDRDFTLWPQPGSELSVDLSSSSISIPIVGGLSQYQNCITTPSQP